MRRPAPRHPSSSTTSPCRTPPRAGAPCSRASRARRRLRLRNSALSELIFNAQRLSLHSFNGLPHLQDEFARTVRVDVRVSELAAVGIDGDELVLGVRVAPAVTFGLSAGFFAAIGDLPSLAIVQC